jgi:Protein of unknown function (DUF1682)
MLGASRPTGAALAAAVAAAVLPLVASAEGGVDASEALGLPVVDAVYLSMFERLVALLVVAFAVNFAVGLRTNYQLGGRASAILDALLAEEFASIGVDEKGTRLAKDGPCDFVYYASGRRHTTGLTAAFELRNRQDLLACILRVFQPSMKDRCVLTLPLSADFAMEPVSLLLIKPKELERARSGGERTSACVAAVEELAGEVRTLTALPGRFHALADHDGVIKGVLSEPIRALLAPVAAAVHFVQLTDSGRGWDVYSEQAGRRFVRLVFDLPVASVEEMHAVLEPMVAVALALVDLSAKVKLSPAARTKALELRKRAADAAQKALLKAAREAQDEKRLAKKRADETAAEARTAGSAAKQAKALDKKRRDEVRARMKKATRTS